MRRRIVHLPLPSQDTLLEYFKYVKSTGVVSWKKNTDPIRPKIKTVVGSYDSRGHLQVMFFGKTYMLHRIIWMMVTGEDPGKYQIDHKNCVRDDNRWHNLRLASQNNNQHNCLIRKDNSSGVKGVCITKHGKFWARVMVDNVQNQLGVFDTMEEAKDALVKFRTKHHKNFKRHA